jgi:hypothetical protein
LAYTKDGNAAAAPATKYLASYCRADIQQTVPERHSYSLPYAPNITFCLAQIQQPGLIMAHISRWYFVPRCPSANSGSYLRYGHILLLICHTADRL